MRLVFIAPFARYPKSTTRLRTVPLARALAARGHEVTVLVPPYDNPEESGAVQAVGAAKVETLHVNGGVSEASARQALVQPRLALDLVRRALALRPHVVHVFKPKAVSGIAQLLLWYGRMVVPAGRRPSIVLDTDDWEGHGGWNEYEAYPWWQKQICDWQERWGLRHADAITAASRTLQAQAWSHRVAAGRAVYLPNGLDPLDYPTWESAGRDAGRARLGLGDEPVLLLYTRFFEFEPERVWAVLERVRARIPAVRLMVIGGGKYGQEQRLASLAAQTHRSAIVFAGWQQPQDLPALLAAGDVALFPSDDNLANRAKCSVKLLETLWLRRAVVADRVGQQAEYVVDGTSGLLSDPADPESMAAAAVRLIEDGVLRRRLGEAGHHRVVSQFGWHRLAGHAEQAYQVALAARAV